MVAGALLAAGRSVRMGRAKALLPAGVGGATFVRQLADALRAGGILDLLVVGRPDDQPLRDEVAKLGAGVRYVENGHADQGQISSIVAAVDAVDRPDVEGLLVLPVDQPLVTSATVATLLSAFSETEAVVVRAVHAGRHGHPAIFSRSIFADLRRADRSIGAKEVLLRHRAAILDVDVPDPGVVVDVDDPETYARVFGMRI